MASSINCPSCNARLDVNANSSSGPVPCPDCGVTFLPTDAAAEEEIETIPLRLPDTPEPEPEPQPRRKRKRAVPQGQQQRATRPKSASTKAKKRKPPDVVTFKESPAFKVIVGVAIVCVVAGGVVLSGLLSSDSPEETGANLLAENTANELEQEPQDDTAHGDNQSSTAANVGGPANGGAQNSSSQADESPASTPSQPAEDKTRVESDIPKSIAKVSPKNSHDKPSVKTTVAATESSKTPSQTDTTTESRLSVLKRIKAATVYIEVTTTTGGQSGSGFLIDRRNDRGIVITNAHVIEPESGTVTRIKCVFHSGSKEEFEVVAKVTGRDGPVDLASLAVEQRGLPEPFALDSEIELHETMPVLVLGFPFGGALKTSRRNPDITISKSAISSIRRDDSGNLAVIQIDGGMNSGNSGGPMVTEDGRLVGVSVAKVRDTDIGFGIPRPILLDALRGRAGQITLDVEPITRETLSAGTINLKLTTVLMDPFNNVEKITLHTFDSGDPETIVEPSDGKWKQFSPTSKTVELKLEDGAATAKFVGSKITWVQLHVSRKDGDQYFTRPAPIVGALTKVNMAKAMRPTPSRPNPSTPPSRPKPITPRPSPTAPPSQLPVNDEVVKLPGVFSDVDVAGNGRFLVFNLKSINKLAVMDVADRSIVGYIDPGGESICTAGAENIFVVLPDKRLIQRWSLAGLTREKVQILSIDVAPSALAIGHSSNGPILVGGGEPHAGEYRLIDTTTLSAIDFKFDPTTGPGRFEVNGQSSVRASANGSVFTCWTKSGSPGGMMALSMNGTTASSYYGHSTVGYISPSADGSRLYTARGTYSPQVKLIGENKELFATSFPIPAVTGEYFLKVERIDSPQQRSPPKRPQVTIFMSGHDQPIVSLPQVNIRGGQYEDFFSREEVPLDKRVLFFPDHDVLATLPEANDSIIFRDVSIDEKLEESGIDYLFVTSSPRRQTAVGSSYEYQMAAKSKHGKLVFKKLSGPAGLKVDAKGKITWRPGVKDSGSHDILMSVSDAMGTEVYHTFKLEVLAKGAGKA